MDLRKIKKLIDLLEESNLAEIEIKEGEESVRLARSPTYALANPAYHPGVVGPLTEFPSPTPGASARAPQQRTSALTAPTEDLPEGHILKSPMIGTFYASPAPDKPAFVTVGQSITAGETVGIIEAMKTFNPIEADASGTILAIMAKNGEPVEFDQPLFVIG